MADAGVLISESAAAAVKGVCSLLSDAAVWYRLAMNAGRMAREVFSLEANAQALETVLDCTASRPGGRCASE